MMAKKLEIEQTDSIYDLIKLISESEDSEFNILFKKGSDLYTNSTNLIVLKKIAEEKKKIITFDVEDQNHKDFIESANNGTLDFEDSSVDLEHISSEPAQEKDHTSLDNGTKVKLKTAGFLGFASKIRKRKSDDGIDYTNASLTNLDKKNKTLNSKPIKKIAIITASVVGFFGLLLGLWVFVPSAEIKLKVDSEVLVKLIDAKASTSQTSVSAEEKTIPAVRIEVTETYAQSAPSTGKKEIGEFATGEITVFNKTDKDFKISKGTPVELIQTDKENLLYEATEEATIPAQTVTVETTVDGETSTVTYGSRDVKIKALSFGEKYNVSDGKTFEIDDKKTDQIVGENEKDIKGGTSKTVDVVTQEDLDKLKQSVQEFMNQRVKDSLNQKIVGGQVMPEASISVEEISSKFSAIPDEEKSEVTLSVEYAGSGLTYSESDADKLVQELISTVIPEEYTLNEEDPEYEVAVFEVDKEANTMNLQIKLRSYIIPNLDLEKIKNQISGMRIEDAQNYLSNISGVSDYEIVLSPSLPDLIRRIPHRENNILITVQK